jgi:serine/threonine protein phosphatase PrpC
MNGWWIDMEDRVLVEYNALAGFGVFGVFDGHGNGGHASDYVARNLRGKSTSRPEWASAYRACNSNLLASLIASACHDLDEGLWGDASRPKRDGGTTGIIALVCNCHLIMANVGDSCCILMRKKKERLGGGGCRWCRGGGVRQPGRRRRRGTTTPAAQG